MPQFDVASRGFAVGPGGGYDSSAANANLGTALAGLAQSALPNPQADANRALARTRNADAALKEGELEGRSALAKEFAANIANNVRTNPEGSADQIYTGIVNMYEQALQSGMAPDDIANLGLAMGGLAGLDNSTLMNLRAGTGRATGPDESLTQNRQDQIRSQNFAQETSLQGSKNATDLQIANIQEAGKDRRDTGGGGEKPPKVDFGDLGGIDAEIDAQLGLGEGSDMAIAPDLKAKVRASAIQRYRSGADPTSSVAESIAELLQVTQPSGGDDYIPFNESPGSITEKPSSKRRVFNPATGRLE